MHDQARPGFIDLMASVGFLLLHWGELEEVVRTSHAARHKRPWIPLPYEPSDAMPSYAEMCPTDPAGCLSLTPRVGGKAASLGFLTQSAVLGRKGDAGSLSGKYGYDLVPAGLGVPFSGLQLKSLQSAKMFPLLSTPSLQSA